jgi:hypothetical protein
LKKEAIRSKRLRINPREAAMAKSILSTIVLLLGLKGELRASALEEKYLATRDSFIKRFEKIKSSKDAENKQALDKLEKQLKEMIGPIKIEGFSEQGTINLETLQRNGGFGQADGLIFTSPSHNELLFVTTKGLLKHYATNKELPIDLDRLSRTNEIYLRVFSWDSAFTLFTEMPITNIHGLSMAHAFLALNAQDIGPFIPTTLLVFIAKGNLVLLVKSNVQDQINEIPACKEEWDKFDKKSSEALDVYQSSELKDQKAFDDHIRYGNEGFEAYRNCFGRNIKFEPIFPSLMNQVQSIVTRLEK